MIKVLFALTIRATGRRMQAEGAMVTDEGAAALVKEINMAGPDGAESGSEKDD